ncbi:MAG: hypothetical protein ABI372_01950 [Ginsengibacter sp.]
MKKILFLLLLPAFSFAQKDYDIIGISVNSTMQNLISPFKIIKSKMRISVKDSLFITEHDGKSDSVKITKKVSDHYFEISDGLQHSIVTIGEFKSKKYSGFITVQSDKFVTSLYFK